MILDFLASLRGFLFLRSLPSLRPSAPPISSHHTLIRHMPSHLSPCLLLLVLSLSPHTHVSPECCPLTLSLTCAHTRYRPACDEGVILLDAETGRVREGEREEKKRNRGRCGGIFEEGRGRRFGVEPVRKKLTLTHSHSFVHADSVCPIDSSDETAPHSDNTHTHTMQPTAACSLTRTDTTVTTLSSASCLM